MLKRVLAAAAAVIGAFAGFAAQADAAQTSRTTPAGRIIALPPAPSDAAAPTAPMRFAGNSSSNSSSNFSRNSSKNSSNNSNNNSSNDDD